MVRKEELFRQRVLVKYFDVDLSHLIISFDTDMINIINDIIINLAGARANLNAKLRVSVSSVGCGELELRYEEGRAQADVLFSSLYFMHSVAEKFLMYLNSIAKQTSILLFSTFTSYTVKSRVMANSRENVKNIIPCQEHSKSDRL